MGSCGAAWLGWMVSSSASFGSRSGIMGSPHGGTKETEQEQAREQHMPVLSLVVFAQVTPDSFLLLE